MEIFLFLYQEACLCQDTQQLAGYENGAREFPLPRLLKHTWTPLKAQPSTRMDTEAAPPAVWAVLVTGTWKTKGTGALDFAENIADHKLWTKVFITLISPKEYCRKGDSESGFSVLAHLLNWAESRNRWWKPAMEFGNITLYTWDFFFSVILLFHYKTILVPVNNLRM